MVKCERDSLDACISHEMEAHGIPCVSIAVVADGELATARAYGVTEAGNAEPATTEMLFQSASVSKVVTAIMALRLVEQGALALDEDVNIHLLGWKIPVGEFTQTEKVTVRRILSHTAGINVHGFPGYTRSEPLPSVEEILAGGGNTPAVRVTHTPGQERRYSGGGYLVLQKLMADITGKPFEVLAAEMVLDPIGMHQSTFEQPLSPAREAASVSGHTLSGAPVPGRWMLYPEASAAGLWSTPSDLAQLIIAIQHGLKGSDGGVSRMVAHWLTTPIVEGQALGLSVAQGAAKTFSHGGRNAGFDAFLLGARSSGAVIMINRNENSGAITRIARAVRGD